VECHQVRARLTEWLVGEPAGPERETLRSHLGQCRACAEELASMRETWGLLGRWPDLEPDPAIGRRLLRRVRWWTRRDVLLAPESWRAAALAAVVGVGLSIVMSLLIPYNTLVALCRQVIAGLVPEAGAFLLAGSAYGVMPLALGVFIGWRRGSPGPWLGATEATLLFLTFLAPYVIVQCREFSLPAVASFVGGLALGALGGGLVASRLLPGAGIERLSSP